MDFMEVEEVNIAKSFDLSIIYTRHDGSFLVNQGLYHVPNEGEWEDLWAQVAAYAKEHPEVVQAEPTPPEPTAEELAARRIAELEAYLSKTDWYAVRFAETGVPVPEEVREARASAREEISALREAMA